MKKITYLFIGLIFVLTACESVIDLQPLDQIADTQVWTSEPLADAYLAEMYSQIQFKRTGNNTFTPTAGMSGELSVFTSGHTISSAPMSPMNAESSPGSLAYWKYDIVRGLNVFIEEVTNSETFTDDYKNQRVSEARWLRAYVYFEMVKRYGGIPLLTKAQAIDTPEEELFPVRNKEQEIYDFINTELDEIFPLLPESYTTEKGRCTKWAAKALQSRAMLYAASIANFGSVQLNGVVGIPVSDANKYYQKAYDASKTLIDDSDHLLYKKHSDPVINHHRLFIDEMEDNPEVIFSQRHDFASDNGTSLHVYMVHADFAFKWNSYFRPTLDFAEKFEFIDGTSGAIDRSLYTKKEWDMADLFHNRDPRFKAAFLYNGAEAGWKASNYDSNIAYFHEKSIGTAPDGANIPSKASSRSFKCKPTNLRHGFLLRKFLDETTGVQLNSGESNMDFHIFRLGETYLNMAEAAYYLNKPEALTLLNEIRDRAGMPAKTEITEDIIRNERTVELAFEEQLYWDLRRWRNAETELNGKQFKGLKFVHYNHDTGMFKIGLGNAFVGTHTFEPQHYYLPIKLSRIGDNPNLIENPGY